MSQRRPDHRLAKLHRNYTVDEVARLIGVHKGTVRQWLKQGLPAIDDRRPLLILGRELRAFLENRRRTRKRPCAPGEIYCMRCRSPRGPAGGIADWIPRGHPLGDLVGICPDCEALMYRRTNILNLASVRGTLQVAFPEGQSRIGERSPLSVNADLMTEATEHANAQPD